jgi:uncharacterized membrane protein
LIGKNHLFDIKDNDIITISYVSSSNHCETKLNYLLFLLFFIFFFCYKGSSHLTQKDIKTQFNKNRKQSAEEVIELKNDDSRDWWTKYFASVESAIVEVRIA